MTAILQITLIGAAAGVVGTGLGGLIINLFGTPSKKTLSFILASSGGIMLAVVFHDLIPEALEYGTLGSALSGMVLGIGMLLVLDGLIPHAHVSTTSGQGKSRSRFIRTSLLLGIGIAMHNFPEGLAIGSGYMANEQLGIGLALILAIHNTPEGMAMAGPMKAAQINPLKIVGLAGLAGLPMGIGALVGGIIGSISEAFLSLSLGFAAGAMLFLVFDELLPIAQETSDGRASTFGALAGVMVGLLFLVLLQ